MLGTVPTHFGDGEVFGRVRAAALADSGDGQLCYLEWSADPGCDLDDREAWAQANPALGRRITVDAVAAERRELSPEGFARERLGLWPVDRLEHVFPIELWTALAAPGPPDGTPPAALAVDACPDRTLAIAGAWVLDDSVLHVEVIAIDYVADPLQALQWVVERAGRRIPVVIDGASPAASMIPALHAQKVQGHYDDGRRYGESLRRVPRRRAGRPIDARRAAATRHRGGGCPPPADWSGRRVRLGSARRHGLRGAAGGCDAGPVRCHDRWAAQNRCACFV